MGIAERVALRDQARMVLEFGLEIVSEEELSGADLEHFWCCVVDLVGEQCSEVITKFCKKHEFSDPPARKTVSARSSSYPERSDPLDDESPMPFGKHEGDPLMDVPDSYFHWLSQQDWIEHWPALLEYIQQNDLD